MRKEKGEPMRDFNLDFERALLGNFLYCADVGIEPNPGFETVPPENYYLEEHRILARLIDELNSRGVTPSGPVLYDELIKKNVSEPRTQELTAYFSSLGDGVARHSPNLYYAGWINRLAQLRKITKIRQAISASSHHEEMIRLNEDLKQAIEELPPEP